MKHQNNIQKQYVFSRIYIMTYSKSMGGKVKGKKTLRKNYGVDYPIQNDKVRTKMKKTINKKYGIKNTNNKNDNLE